MSAKLPRWHRPKKNPNDTFFYNCAGCQKLIAPGNYRLMSDVYLSGLLRVVHSKKCIPAAVANNPIALYIPKLVYFKGHEPKAKKTSSAIR